jgi:fructokinase
VLPEIQADDIVMFGSYYAVNPVIRPQVQGFLEYARDNGAIIYYDVNFRASHQNEVVKLNANILENLEYSDIVRGSKEDFEVMFNKKDAETVYKAQISFYCKDFIYTQGADPVEVRGTGNFSRQYPVLQTETVSTIGAGDNFNAGFVYGLIKYGITREMLEAGLSPEQWDALIGEAREFSANVCGSINNSIGEAFANQKKRELEVCLKEMEENIL